MKISTILIAAVAALTALSGAVVVQHGGDMSEHFAVVAKHLHLTPSQEKQMKAEHEAAQKKINAINANTKLDENAKNAARAKVHADIMAKAKTILTPEQMKQLEGIIKSMANQHEMMAMMEKLGLSADQKTAVHKVFANAMTKMEAIHNNSKLTDAQKQAQAEALHSDVMAQIHGILTPEQMEKAKQLHQGAGHSIPPK